MRSPDVTIPLTLSEKIVFRGDILLPGVWAGNVSGFVDQGKSVIEGERIVLIEDLLVVLIELRSHLRWSRVGWRLDGT